MINLADSSTIPTSLRTVIGISSINKFMYSPTTKMVIPVIFEDKLKKIANGFLNWNDENKCYHLPPEPEFEYKVPPFKYTINNASMGNASYSETLVSPSVYEFGTEEDYNNPLADMVSYEEMCSWRFGTDYDYAVRRSQRFFSGMNV